MRPRSIVRDEFLSISRLYNILSLQLLFYFAVFIMRVFVFAFKKVILSQLFSLIKDVLGDRRFLDEDLPSNLVSVHV